MRNNRPSACAHACVCYFEFEVTDLVMQLNNHYTLKNLHIAHCQVSQNHFSFTMVNGHEETDVYKRKILVVYLTTNSSSVLYLKTVKN